MSPSDSLDARLGAVWNECYPDRRPWAEIGEEARAEWHRVFTAFERTTITDEEIRRAEARRVDGERILSLDAGRFTPALSEITKDVHLGRPA